MDVGELVVRLTMEHGDVKSQIRQINTEMKSLDSGFKASEAAAGGFSSAMDRAKAMAGTLGQKLEVQKRAVSLLAEEQRKAQDRLAQANAKYQQYGQSLEQARAKHDGLKSDIERVKAAMEQSAKATGDNTEEYISLSVELDNLNAALKASGTEVATLERQYANADKSIARAESAVQRSTIALGNARATQSQLQNELDKTNAKIKNHVAALEDASKKLTEWGKQTSDVGKQQEALGKSLMGVTALVAAGGTAAATAAITWEDSFAGVIKTVDGTEEQLESIEQSLLDMSKVKPSKPVDLSGIAADAGQLGIATENVVNFTHVVSDLAETTDLTTDAAAKSFAQFANITQMDPSNYERMGSSLVELGNTSATTESAIMAMAMNLAAAGNQAGMAQPSILGIAAALSSVGLEAAGGGTAISRAIINMMVAVETGNDDLKEFASVAGMTAEQFATAFRDDATSAVAAFITGLGSGTDSAVKMLTEMGITETRQRDALLRLAGSGDLLTRSIANSANAWKANTALTKEAEVRYGTTASKMAMLGNKAQIAGIQIGNDFLPMINDGIDVVGDMVESFGNLDASQRQQIIRWAAIAAAAGPAVMLLGRANSAIGTVATGIGKFTANMAAAGGGVGGLVGAVGKLLGPAGIVAVGVAAVAAAGSWIDYATGAKAAREATEGMIDTAKRWKDTQATTIYDTGNDQLGRFGLSEADFAAGTADAKSWFDSLKATWSDGKKETNDIVQQYVDDFTASSDQLREAIERRREILAGLGVTDTQGDAHLKQLDEYDREIEALLKKRQNGKLTEDDEARLTEVIEQRVQIQLEYVTGEGGSYEQILAGVEAERARIEAEGGTVGVDLYADAMAAAAKGNAAYNQTLNDTYNEQHKVIAAMEDGADKEAALAALNAQHQQAKTDAAKKYAETLSEVVGPALESEGVDGAETKLQSLLGLLSEYQIATQTGAGTSGILEQMQALTDGMDEGELAGYLAIITQIQDAITQGGLTPEEAGELFPTIDPATILGGYQSLGEFLSANAGTFEGLEQMFTDALPEEVQRVMVELGLDGAAQQWADFIDGKDVFTTTVELDESGLPTTTTGSVFVPGMVELSPIDMATIANFRAANKIELDGQVKKVGMVDGAQQTFKDAFDKGLLALYDANGIKIPVTPEAVAAIQRTDLVHGIDEEGVLHVQIVPTLGSQEGLEITQEKMETRDQEHVPGWGYGGTAQEQLTSVTETLNTIKELREIGNEAGADMMVTTLLQELRDMDVSNLETIGEHLAGLMAALNSGELDEGQAEAVKAQIEEILALVEGSEEYLGIGNDVSAGVAEGMVSYGWTGDTGTMGSNLVAAIRGSLQTHSPSALTKPIGTDVAAGVGVGMTEYGFAADAAAMGAAIEAAITGGMPSMSNAGAKLGKDFSNGVAAGIRAGRSSVVNAAAQIAAAAVNATKSELQINSPSRVGLGIGGNYTNSIAMGELAEADKVEKATRKMLSPMTGAALDDIDVQINRRMPDVLGGMNALENKVISIEMARAYAPSQPAAVGGAGLVIDYGLLGESVADAVAERPLGFALNGRDMATAMGRDALTASRRENRRTAFAYGVVKR